MNYIYTVVQINIKVISPTTMDNIDSIEIEYESQGKELCIKGMIAYHDGNVADMKLYWLEAIKLGNPIAMNNYALWHHSEGNTDQMIDYLNMAIQKGFMPAINNIIDYYTKEGDKENKLKYQVLAFENGELQHFNNILRYYKNTDNDEKVIEFYQKGIEKGIDNAESGLINYYMDQKNTVKIEEYYANGIANSCKESYNSLIAYFEKIDDKHNIEKYLLKGLEKNIDDMLTKLIKFYKTANNECFIKYSQLAIARKEQYAIYNFALYYKEIDNNDEMVKFLLLGAEEGCEKCKVELNKYLSNCTDVNILIKYHKYLDSATIRKLNTIYIKYLEYRDIDFSPLSKIDDCPICLVENTDMVLFSCKHGVCAKCYPEIIKTNKCPYCRGPI